MVSVALVRPVWWIACRSVRFVTALVLMALLLGGGGLGTGTPPAVAATESASGAIEARPAAAAPVASSVDIEASGVVDPAGAQGAVAGQTPTTAGERSAEDGTASPAVVAGPAVHLGQPDRSGARPGIGPRSGPAGDAFARVIGPRAPPLG